MSDSVKKRVIFGVLFLVFLGLVLAGCGKKEQAATETKQQVEFRFGYPSSVTNDYKMMMDHVIPLFEEQHPDIKVKFEYMPWGQFRTKLLTELAANQAPDLWISDGVHFMNYASRGAILDLTDWIKRDFNKEDYLALDFASDPEGRIWGVPREIQMTVFYYNKKLFDEAGVDYPDETWDWDTLLSAAKKLTKQKDAKVKQYGYHSQNWITAGWFNFIYQNGGRILDETRTKSMLDQPEVVEAVKFMVDLIYKHKVSPTGEVLEGAGALGGPFPSQLVAMQYNNSIQVSVFNKSKDLDYDIAVLPKRKIRAVSYNANPFVINSKSSPEKAEAAWKFIKFFASNEKVQRLLAEGGFGIPILKKAIYSDAFMYSSIKPDNKAAFIEPLEDGYALPMDLNKCWGEWNNAINQNLSLAWLGEITPEEAVINAHKAVQKILDSAFSNND
ncbi:MAG: sugar ABC transporter substrate-binding protein [Clostridiales bacterium]|nr:sugar ABC transporter substrate-binding protein [Clostridiales bacterium]